MEDNFNIDYKVFTDRVIQELSKILLVKCRDNAITILEHLKAKPRLCMKKDLRNLFPKENVVTIDKCIESLEDTCAITYTKAGTSNIYEISSVGEKMLKILKEVNPL